MKIPSSNEYLDKRGFALIPGQLYFLDGTMADYYMPVSRPSKIFPFWSCIGLRNGAKHFSVKESRKLELFGSEKAISLLEFMIKEASKFPSFSEEDARLREELYWENLKHKKN